MCSPASYALRVHVERIDRVARRHEQPVTVAAAEADVGGALGQRYEADRLAGRIEYLDAVERRAHAPAARRRSLQSQPQSTRHRALQSPLTATIACRARAWSWRRRSRLKCWEAGQRPGSRP